MKLFSELYMGSVTCTYTYANVCICTYTHANTDVINKYILKVIYEEYYISVPSHISEHSVE